MEFHESIFWFCICTFQLHVMLYKLWDNAVIWVMTPCSLVGWHNKCHTQKTTTLNFYETSNLTLLDQVILTLCCVSLTYCFSWVWCFVVMLVCLLLCQSKILFLCWFHVLLLCWYLLLQNFHSIFKERNDIVIWLPHSLLYIGSYELHFYCTSEACACKNSLNLEVITPSIIEYLMLLPKIDRQLSLMPLFSGTDWDNSTLYTSSLNICNLLTGTQIHLDFNGKKRHIEMWRWCFPTQEELRILRFVSTMPISSKLP